MQNTTTEAETKRPPWTLFPQSPQETQPPETATDTADEIPQTEATTASTKKQLTLPEDWLRLRDMLP
jgi:hypothetical protein